MMFIATLPSLGFKSTIEKIVNEEAVDAVRYNTGNDSPYETVAETMQAVVDLSKDKILYVDIEGRQIRVSNWGYPKYGSRIELNREVEVELPAQIFFRGDNWYDVTFVNGNRVFIDGLPEKAVGLGQTVNIDSDNWRVVGGYLSHRCKEYISESIRLGIRRFCLSFIESWTDVEEVEYEIFSLLPETEETIELVLKIESCKGLAFVRSIDHFPGRERKPIRYRLMVARDDLSTNLSADKFALLKATLDMYDIDNEAILASNIFMSLIQNEGEISQADILEVLSMQNVGFKYFMLSDEISKKYLHEAADIWGKIQALHKE